jgi:phosphoadenylyl-sulfate reductase (thioredoxin)
LQSTPQQLLRWAIEEFGAGFAVTTSFQKEGMVIVDMAARIDPSVRVITLDTGRLPEETYTMMESVRERYGIRVETITPRNTEVEGMTRLHGPNLFYRDEALRKLCCEIRKVRPMDAVIEGLRAWAVGLRRSQSEARAGVEEKELVGGRYKLSPLAAWTREQVEEYIQANHVPVHPLYARGYTSIGCGPCTRAVEAGEDERAGRWWWELDAEKECGLHVAPDGRIRRELDVLLEEVLTARNA